MRSVVKLFVILLSVGWSIGASGQSEIEKRIKHEMWNNCPAEFKNTKIPDKWKKESAVVIAFHREYILDFTTKVTGLANVSRFYVEKLNYHFRIKLLDKAAVTDYSELAFNNKTVKTNLFGKASAYRMIGIKVIKPDGEEKEVDLSQAVKTDVTSSRELKIPIPNLEEGDIIDYFIAIRDEGTTQPDFGDEYVLEFKYPAVSTTLTFSVPHQYSFHYSAYNGAPEFTKQKVDKDVIYTLKDEMRGKAPDLLWYQPMRSSPHVRYRISPQTAVVEMDKEARKLLSNATFNPSDIGYILDFMDGNFKKTTDVQLLTRELYFLLRNPIYMRAYYKTELGAPLDAPLSPNNFFLLVDKYLTKQKISHELLIAPSREMDPWNRLVNLSSCEFFIRINTNPPVYLGRPHPFALPGEVSYMYEGTQGVSAVGLREIVKSKPEENATKTRVKVSIDPGDLSKVGVARNIVAKGHNKLAHQYLIVTNFDYLQEYDVPKYQVQKSGLIKSVLKEYNNEKTKFSQRLTQDYHERDERIRNSLERDFDVKVVDYTNLTIKSIGMWSHEPDTEYEDSFFIENLARKVGPNIMVDIGKLIEKQTEVKDEQKDRDRDVVMPYPRMFEHEIRVNVPAGYIVEGLNSLNKSVKNDMGEFVSVATVADGVLTIRTSKVYRQYDYDPSQWKQIVPFLTAATDFYSTKILFKKS